MVVTPEGSVVTVDFGSDVRMDRLVSVTAESGDTVVVLRAGREVFRLEALPGVVVEVEARLPRLEERPSLPRPADGERPGPPPEAPDEPSPDATTRVSRLGAMAESAVRRGKGH